MHRLVLLQAAKLASPCDFEQFVSDASKLSISEQEVGKLYDMWVDAVLTSKLQRNK